MSSQRLVFVHARHLQSLIRSSTATDRNAGLHPKPLRLLTKSVKAPRGKIQREWYSLTPDTSCGTLAEAFGALGLAVTKCDANNDNRESVPFPIGRLFWIQYFVRKDPEFDWRMMTYENFFETKRRFESEYSSVIDTYFESRPLGV